MKYRKRVFAMDERELKAAMNLLVPEKEEEIMKEETNRRAKMQEELVQWLLSEGLSLRHEFLLYREDTPTGEGPGQEPVWLLSRRTRGCPCCDDGHGASAKANLSTAPSKKPASSISVLPMKNQKTAQQVVFRKPPPNSFLPKPTNESPKNMPKTTKTNEVREKAKVVTLQPMPTDGIKKDGEKIGEKKPPEKKKPFGEECCIECGHFCVDLISTLK